MPAQGWAGQGQHPGGALAVEANAKFGGGRLCLPMGLAGAGGQEFLTPSNPQSFLSAIRPGLKFCIWIFLEKNSYFVKEGEVD